MSAKEFPKKLIRKVLQKNNLQILHKDSFDRLNQEVAVKSELLNFYTKSNIDSEKANSLEVIIFSMDRAIQLHALLSSFYENIGTPLPVHIIYRTTSEQHEKAYQDVFKIFENNGIDIVKQIDKSTFKKQLLDILDKVKSSKVFFLVDDILFKEKVDLNEITKFNTRDFVFSLRMGDHLKYCYTASVDQPLPKFHNEMINENDKLCWKWSEGFNDWNYPLSVDGHIFSTGEIKILTKYTDFNSPNTYEGHLQLFRDYFLNRYGVSFKKSRIVNLPINKVNDDTQNISGNIDPEFLLKKWNEGYQIDYKAIYGFVNISAHQEIPINFIKR